MCGIAGIISKNPINRDKFEKMVDLVSYRGPDDRGTFYDGNVAFGHRRLSILDLSQAGHQPFIDRHYVLVYNGEIYNYQVLRGELENYGYKFSTNTDTEVLIKSYKHWGSECVQKLNGMWAFAIYDREKHVVFCSRDRFGIKPFYYYMNDNTLIFASEIKQILFMRGSNPQANRERLMEFLIGGIQDYTSETFFKGIYQLTAGTNLLFDVSEDVLRPQLRKWYDLSKIPPSQINYDEAIKEFKSTFFDAVRIRLRADVPIGFCLSGGLDSSSIVCVASEILKSDMHSVSSCFDGEKYSAYDEQEFIDEVVKKTGIKSHKVYPSFNNLFSQLDDIIYHMDTPFGSTSIFAQWTVFAGAQENGLTVMLDGQGSDEQLAGYSGFIPLLWGNLLKKGKIIEFLHEYKAYKYLHPEANDINKFLLSMLRNTFLPKLLEKIATRNFLKSHKIDTPFSIEDYLVFKDRFYCSSNPREYILDQLQCELMGLLQFEDRNSMAHSIESRVPFLDYRLVENIFSYPLEYKVHSGKTKVLIRDALDGVLPEKITKRYSKLGFVTPEDVWFRDNGTKLKKEIDNAVNRLTPLLNRKLTNEWLNRKSAFSRGNFTIFRIICAAHWANIFDVHIA